jgi:phosphoesterase RecJ-like protein
MQDLSPKQQAIELIRQAKSVLVVSHKNPDGDSLGSMIALKIALEKMDKTVDLACPDAPGKIFSFLPRIDEIKNSIDIANDFIITLDTSSADVEKLGYKRDEANHKVDIVISSRSGSFDQSDVSFTKSGSKYDLIVVVDTPNLERLDKLASPTDIFFQTPLVNIDHHPSNERFGKVNLIELVATSTSEILVSLLEALSKEKQLMDEDIATALLAGLIYDTSSFQNINTTPKSLTVAAQLVASGGRQQEIIRNLYKTKSLETLKLWGFILSAVRQDKEGRFLWSSVGKQDMESVGADENALSGVIDELLKSATDVDFAMLLSEREGDTHGSLRSISQGFNVAQIAEIFGGGGHEVASAFRIEGDLHDNEEKILTKIRQFMSKKPLQTSEEDSNGEKMVEAIIEPSKDEPTPELGESQSEEKSPLEVALADPKESPQEKDSDFSKTAEPSVKSSEFLPSDQVNELGFTTVIEESTDKIPPATESTNKTKW